jgi:hypothetical protein
VDEVPSFDIPLEPNGQREQFEAPPAVSPPPFAGVLPSVPFPSLSPSPSPSLTLLLGQQKEEKE